MVARACCWGVMVGAVEFHHEAGRWAVEIHYPTLDDALAVEFGAEGALLEVFPQDALALCWRVA